MSQSHLCRNPRVLKEALALAEAGYNVHILTAVYSSDLLNEDRQLISGQPISYSFYSELQESGLQSFLSRLVKRSTTVIQEKFGIESKQSLGYSAYRLKKYCKKINAGLYIMHQELPAVIGGELLHDGLNVAFDLEDWYSEDLLPEAQAKRPLALLKRAESAALKNGAYCTTTSGAMAEKMAEAYKSKPPVVVYNAFPVAENIPDEKQFVQPLKLFWFSQTIGAGRGLEEFISLLKQVPLTLELHLLGNIDSDYRNTLMALMPNQHSIAFHKMVSNQELPTKIAQFDIGLALELSSPPSRDHTITNKFFQYIESGLPVITSETAGQKEIFSQFKPGILLPQDPTESDIEKLTQWLNDAGQLKLARQQALQAANFFSWEKQSQKIIDLVTKALETSG